MNLTATDMMAVTALVSAICSLAAIFVRLTIKNILADSFATFRKDLAAEYVSQQYFNGYRDQQIRDMGRLEGEVKSLSSHSYKATDNVQEQLRLAHVAIARIKMKVGMDGSDIEP